MKIRLYSSASRDLADGYRIEATEAEVYAVLNNHSSPAWTRKMLNQ
jgi:hypothetical protein